MSKPTLEERNAKARDDALEEKFGSMLVLSVKVMRPSAEYPYEVSVWDSEIRVAIGTEDKNVDSIVTAWVKSMEAGVEIAQAFSQADKEEAA
jgi:transcription antitermination factor NusA-like protein